MVAHHPVQIQIQICEQVADAEIVGVNSKPHLIDNIQICEQVAYAGIVGVNSKKKFWSNFYMANAK
jgi:hypothetical protein